VIDWNEARDITFDVILAAHASARFSELRGPAIVLPHGVGYNRRMPHTTGDQASPSGLAPGQLLGPDGEPAVARVLLSHPSQQDWLRRVCPEVVGLAVVLGDPVLDRMRASRRRREEFRRELGLNCGQQLVVVSSTWGEYSIWSRHHNLLRGLLSALPMDRYRVALVLHPNIWRGESPLGVQHCLRDELDSGLLLVPHQSSWEAVVLSADVMIGDHGSVSFYGATLDVPFLLGADGRPELTPDSPVAELCASAVRLDTTAPLEPQVAGAIERHDFALLRPAADLMFANEGRARETLQQVLYEAMGRPQPSTVPRLRPIDRPRPIRKEPPTSFAVSADLREAQANCGTVVVRRYPLPAMDWYDPKYLFYLVTNREVDSERHSDAEVVVNEEVTADPGAWFAEARKSSPFAALVATRVTGGCVLRFSDGSVLSTSDENVHLVSIAAYAWRRAKLPWPGSLRLRTDVSGQLTERTLVQSQG
jgi:hypothetical protein